MSRWNKTESAAYLRRSEKFLERLVAAGGLASVKVGRCVWFDVNDIVALRAEIGVRYARRFGSVDSE